MAPESVQNEFFEDESKLRTLKSQSNSKNELLISKNNFHCQGYKSDCVLNVLESFKAIENFPTDIMHDLLEGCI